MKISIVGAAGCMGSSIAFCIATRGLAEEVVILDVTRHLLEAQAMDLGDAIVAANQDVTLVAGEYADMVGSDIVIVTASIGSLASRVSSPGEEKSGKVLSSRQELISINIPVIQGIANAVKQYCPDCVMITVSNPVEALSYVSYMTSDHRDRSRFIGFSLNDTIRFRAAVAQAVGVTPKDVQAVVMGEHGDSHTPIFSSIRVKGQPRSLSQGIKENLIEKLHGHTKRFLSLKPGRTTGWLSGIGIADVVRAIRDDSEEVLPLSAILDGEYGYRGFSMSVPLVLGKQGIRRIVDIDLSDEERADLAKSARVCEAATDFVRQTLDIV